MKRQDRTTRWIENFCSMLIVIMTLIIVYRVILRFFFNSTPSWSEELTNLLLVWITLLAFPIGIKKDQHLSLTMFYDKMPRKAQTIIDLIVSLITLCFVGFVMLFNGILMVKLTSTSYLSSLPLSNAILYIMMPIAGFLSVGFVSKKLFHLINTERGNGTKGINHEYE